MDNSTFITLFILFTLMLLALQRTEKKYRWVTAVVMLLPGGWMVYRWAIFKGLVTFTLTALGAAVGLNVLFWVVYGRTHPPHSSDEIRVYGMDDE